MPHSHRLGWVFALCALISCATPSGASDRQCLGFTFFPDGSYVAAVYSSGNSSFIYAISIKTGVATRVTPATHGFEGIPSFSADGKRMAYSYSPGGKAPSHVVISNIDGSDPHAWAPDTAGLRPMLLPDDEHVLFARAGYYGNYSPIAQPTLHEWNFYVADLDGANARQVTGEGFYLVSRAAVSPDGKSLLFVSSEDHGDLIEIYSLSQPSTPKTVIKSPIEEGHGEALVADTVYTPDGRSILFNAATSRSWGPFDYDLYRMDLQSHKIERLTKHIGFAYGLQLSPDGKTAIFMRGTSHWFGHRTEIFLIDVESRRLTSFRITGIQGDR